MSGRLRQILISLAPGILVAATGVGSGDLITAAFAGSRVGAGLAWAAVVGSVLKWFLNEGLARWQMATETTLLEGWHEQLSKWVRYVFFGYLLIWAFVTGGAMVNACGVAGLALFPIGDDPARAKIIWGVVHSIVGLVFVLLGGFRLFERVMGVCIGVMFVTVLVTAALIIIRRDAAADLASLQFPTDPSGRKWLLGVLGGVGGTVTLLSYGYWIREEGRRGADGVRASRIDLAAGYAMTGLFGVAMILIGSQLSLSGGGDSVALQLAEQLQNAVGTAGPVCRWVFLIGFWGAVFSSLLGVWQSTPYFFTDLILLGRRHTAQERRMIVYDRTTTYRVCLVLISIVPLILLWQPSATIQLAYTVLGAFFMPFLALTLLLLNNSRAIPREFRSGHLTNAALVITLCFFGYQGGLEIYETIVRASTGS
ncbi:MAG: Nramp family divalent metal transporter [Phycisphaerae bacterium]|nr:Nramp family divalent metal transporter [Phycisphaerae bacterium]